MLPEPPADAIATIRASAAAVAVLVSIVLWARRSPNPRADRYLAVALLSLALLMFGNAAGWLAFLVGPCGWLYTCRLTGLTGPRGQRFAVHFIAPVAMLLVLLPFYGAPDRFVQPRAPTSLLIVAAVHLLLYALLARLRLRRHPDPWPRRVLWICLAAWALWLVGDVFAPGGPSPAGRLGLPLAEVALCVLGLRGPRGPAPLPDRV